ncbi:MAG: 3'-5' exonuclease, partial [Pseudomonadota bacterium]|nr:3'-5' exonuclease [Pseudomonadota bacterium]
LESDSQLIRLITQHGSKGLEYPIVFVPFATGYRDAAKNGNTTSQIFTYYDEEKQDLQMQLGQTPQAIARVQSESEAEDMRLAYVAVTRAAHRCYMGVVPLTNNERSALARALGVGGDGSNNDWSSVLNRVADEDASHASHIDGDEFEEVYNGFEQEDELPQLTALQFTGTASEEWRLYSFSAMSRLTTAGANQSVETGTAAESGATTEPLSQTLPSVPVLQTIRDEEVYASDPLMGEMGTIDADINSSAGIESTVSKSDLRFTLEKGASAGNLLHDILEHSDFSAPDWEETGKELVNRFGLDEKRTPLLYKWLEEALQTPLYPNMQLSMSDLPLAQTLREAEFYFPMNDTQWTQLREVLATHRQNVADVIGGEMETAPQLITAKLQGMMHGFIDLIFEHDGQFYVADYKSTWLGDTLDSYTPTALFHNNQHHLYDLQYLIYCLALHRYLKNTLPNYDPDMHFGGVYYLYLRGMHPENERGEGVFYTDVPSSVLNRLDGIFASKGDAQQGNSSSNAGSSRQPLEQTSSGQQQFSFDDK